MLTTATFAALLAACAPHVAPRTMTALVTHESGGRPFAIDDDTARRSYAPATRDDAAALVARLLARGHTFDVGYAQVNVATLARYGVAPDAALDPCVNLAVGADVLREDYARALRRVPGGAAALALALEYYHAGHALRGGTYARAVFRLARRLRVWRTR